MRERYVYLIRSGLDLSAAVLIQLTTLAGMVLILQLDSLRNLAYFTFALAVCGPILLFAGMSLMELLFSGDERYRNLRQVALAQLVCFVGLAGLALVMVALWDRSYLPVLAIVAIGRCADLMCALAIHVMRARAWFGRIAWIGLAQLVMFILCASATILTNWAAPVIEIAVALTLTSLAQAALAFYWLRESLRRQEGEEPLRPFAFIRAHLFRSVAIALNSLQGNAPRYGLELLVSPQHQAAYSVLTTIARAGTITFQSLFVPIVGLFRGQHASHPRRAIVMATAGFLAASALFTAVIVGLWLVAIRYGLVARFMAEITAVLSAGEGVLLLISCGVYLLRFGVWQIVSLLDTGRRQASSALAGLVVTTAGVVILTPGFGLIGAALADIAGNLLLLTAPVVYLWLRAGRGRSTAPEQRP